MLTSQSDCARKPITYIAPVTDKYVTLRGLIESAVWLIPLIMASVEMGHVVVSGDSRNCECTCVCMCVCVSVYYVYTLSEHLGEKNTTYQSEEFRPEPDANTQHGAQTTSNVLH